MITTSLKQFLILLCSANRYSIIFFYMVYYFLRRPSKPFLQYHKSKEIYVNLMTSLHEKYRTIFVTEFGILQSFLQLHRIVKEINRQSIRVRVPYNAEIVLDVVNNTTYKNVLLVHGFNGSSSSRYIIGLCHYFKKENYRIFCFNARGTKEILNNEIFFHIGWTVDLKVAVEFILHNYEGSLEIYGFSMGASWVTKYLGEEKPNKRVIKGGAICLPFDFYKIEDWMKKTYKQRFLNRLLAYNFCKYIRRNSETFKNAGLDLNKVFKCKSLRDIDTLLTQKIFNIDDITSYYKNESCVHHLKNISIPFLILNTRDDPIIPEFIIDKKECKKNKNILLVINPWGGHLGFLKNSLRHSVADEMIIQFSKHFK